MHCVCNGDTVTYGMSHTSVVRRVLLAFVGAPAGDDLLILCHQCSPTCNLVDIADTCVWHNYTYSGPVCAGKDYREGAVVPFE